MTEVVDAVTGACLTRHNCTRIDDQAEAECVVNFAVPGSKESRLGTVLEIRIWASGETQLLILSIIVEPFLGSALAPGLEVDKNSGSALVQRSALPTRVEEWLPLLEVGDAAEWAGGVVRIRSAAGKPGHILWGPNQYLLPGCYRVRVAMAATGPDLCTDIEDSCQPVAMLEVVSSQGQIMLVCRPLLRRDLTATEFCLDFAITEAMPVDCSTVEVRVWTDGSFGAAVSSITIGRVGEATKALSAADDASRSAMVQRSALPTRVEECIYAQPPLV